MGGIESWNYLVSGGMGWTCSSWSGSSVFILLLLLICVVTLVLVITHACIIGPLLILMGLITVILRYLLCLYWWLDHLNVCTRILYNNRWLFLLLTLSFRLATTIYKIQIWLTHFGWLEFHTVKIEIILLRLRFLNIRIGNFKILQRFLGLLEF